MILAQELSWSQAACSTYGDPDIFHAEYNGKIRTDAAKVICLACPIRQQCLDYAIIHKEKHGTWGGMTLEERNRYAKKRADYYKEMRMGSV